MLSPAPQSTRRWIPATCLLLMLAAGICSKALAQNAVSGSAFATEADTARFLTQATFGPTPQDLQNLTGTSASDWYQAQLAMPAALATPYLQDIDDAISSAESLFDSEDVLESIEEWYSNVNAFGYWRGAFGGEDQLRQRVTFALSQILVVSDAGGEVLADYPRSMTYYQDVISRNALGNYRDLLEDVTYSPAMGYYLTYLGNRKGDARTGRVPDENYAREILQLFTIGLVELNPDGSARLDGNGAPVETYGNADITGLARVFTGLDVNSPEGFGRQLIEDGDFESVSVALGQPMVPRPQWHSSLEKRFLGTAIPANTNATTSIDRALDAIFAHPNVGPFIGRQLIQRLVTSHPGSEYIQRVASTFDAGVFTLPDGSSVGTGSRGDLAATVAAVLFDTDARDPKNLADTRFGKVREPVLRLTAWARALGAQGMEPEVIPMLWNTSATEALSQQPYRSTSVFNFYRPGYVAPGTLTGAANLTMPELQIMNAASTPGYINTMMVFATNRHTAQVREALARSEDVEIDFETDDGLDDPFEEDLNDDSDSEQSLAEDDAMEDSAFDDRFFEQLQAFFNLLQNGFAEAEDDETSEASESITDRLAFRDDDDEPDDEEVDPTEEDNDPVEEDEREAEDDEGSTFRLLEQMGIVTNIDASLNASSANYTDLIPLAETNVDGLIDELDRRLTYGTLSANTRSSIASLISGIGAQQPQRRVELAVLLFVTSPDFIVQR